MLGRGGWLTSGVLGRRDWLTCGVLGRGGNRVVCWVVLAGHREDQRRLTGDMGILC